MYTSYLAKKQLNVFHLLLSSRAGVDIVFALCRKNQHRSSLLYYLSFTKASMLSRKSHLSDVFLNNEKVRVLHVYRETQTTLSPIILVDLTIYLVLILQGNGKTRPSSAPINMLMTIVQKQR